MWTNFSVVESNKMNVANPVPSSTFSSILYLKEGMVDIILINFFFLFYIYIYIYIYTFILNIPWDWEACQFVTTITPQMFTFWFNLSTTYFAWHKVPTKSCFNFCKLSMAGEDSLLEFQIYSMIYL